MGTRTKNWYRKKLLFRRLKKRYKTYTKIFKLLGTIRDIEYPKEHHLEIAKNKTKLAKTADLILTELYGESGLFMEYKTRSLILKTYQVSYKYINNEVTLEELIDSYYYSRRAIREDLEFDDKSGNIVKNNIIDSSSTNFKILKEKEMVNKIWAIPNQLARSSRPGYPNKNVSLLTLNNTVELWKNKGIKSIICLLSTEEMNMYYKEISGNLVDYYEGEGFKVHHISIQDFQTPPLDKNSLAKMEIEYNKMPKPLLIHCGAGEDRTGQSIETIINKYFK